MEVTIYKVNPECYPRFKNADKRIYNIIERTNKLLLDTFGESNLVRKTVPERNICNNIKLYLCKMQGDKMSLNVGNLVMRNESSTTKQSYNYRNAKEFLTVNKKSFDWTTVLVFQEYKGLRRELNTFLPQGLSVIIVTCLQGHDAEKSYDHLKIKTVTSEEHIAEEIGSLLEQVAFKPMKEMFKYIRSLCYDNHKHSRDSKEPDCSVPEQSQSANGSSSYEGKLGENIEQGISSSADFSFDRHKSNGLKRKCLEKEEHMHAKRKVLTLSSSTNDAYNQERKTRTRTKNGTFNFSDYDSELLKVSTPSSSTNDSHSKGGKMRSKTKNRSCTFSNDDTEEMKGLSGKCNENEHDKTAHRNFKGSSNAQFVDSDASIRKTRSGTVYGRTADEKSNRKFRENKEDFQRLLGEMIGMYRRSRLPETLKPQLDGLEDRVSDQVIESLYQLSPSVRGYSFKFITRLQIHVLSHDIENLRPKIVEILNKHGFKSDSYDVVSPLVDVKPFCKILSGSKVGVNGHKNFGSLTSFVKMTPKTQKEGTYCSLASKHLLQGQETLEIMSEKRTLKADVIKETAPFGDVNMKFDIAAARIKKEDESYCDGRFKTEDGTLMKGIMYENDDSLLDCQHVHMSGAHTSKGLGIIATTHYKTRKFVASVEGAELSQESQQEAEADDLNENNRFIYVKSREEAVPFCKPGDSGAMVCFDHEDGNHVDLISKVIGQVDKQDLYQTLRLRSGVSYLEKLTQSDIEFF